MKSKSDLKQLGFACVQAALVAATIIAFGIVVVYWDDRQKHIPSFPKVRNIAATKIVKEKHAGKYFIIVATDGSFTTEVDNSEYVSTKVGQNFTSEYWINPEK